MALNRVIEDDEPLLNEVSVGSYTENQSVLEEEQKDEGYFSSVPNFLWIESSLLLNVFLAGFDSTVAASTYATIGNEFEAINLAPWITTSYLMTSTAFQPLYGSVSDILGRKACICFALVVFGTGCLGCCLSNSMITLIAMRALSGIGGGGFICLSTITNSDIIHTRKRGAFQAVQNLMLGMGLIFGASLGGYLSSLFNWRLCFLVQLVPTVFSLAVAILFVPHGPQTINHAGSLKKEILQKIDFKGAVLLVSCLMAELLVLTIGEDKAKWISPQFILLIVGAIGLTLLFFKFESRTKAIPIIPINDYKSDFAVSHVVINFLIGAANYSYIFALPLLFQLELGDDSAQAGFRLTIPSLAMPIGGLTAGYLMTRVKSFDGIALSGMLMMGVGNFLASSISNKFPNWLINLLLFPANLGVGLCYPTSLFMFINYFDASKHATSTATVYLMRNIGGVWGVTSMAVIIQTVLKSRLCNHLLQLPYLNLADVEKIVSRVEKSTEVIASLKPEIRDIVIDDYSFSIRVTQVLSGVGCLVALLLCYLSRKI